MQLPLSTRQTQPGTVSTTQSTTNAGGGNSVNLLNSSTNVQGAYAGSTPEGTASATALSLTLDDALSRALRHNLGQLLENEAAQQAEGQRLVARSTLMPNLNAVVRETVEQINLRTMGVEVASFPETVGPFNYFDARGTFQQTVLDFVRLNNLRSARENVEAARQGFRNARDLVVLAVAGSYMQIIAINARVEAARAQVESSRAVNKQAVDRLRVGLDARIDVTRTQVQLQTDQQRLRSLVADLDRQKLRLSRIVGLPLGQQFNIADNFPYRPLTGLTIEDALTRAAQNRADLKAAEAGVHAAEDSLKAARSERLPALQLNADWGAAGLRPTAEAHSVFTVSGSLVVPIYQGGRIHGDIEQANATLRARRAEYGDIRGQVDEDVRQAFINLNAAADQVDVAQSNVSLAHDTLRQAEHRFEAGVADTVEVVQAEQTVVQADNDYISAVFEHNLAKVSLARAMGAAEQRLGTFLAKQP